MIEFQRTTCSGASTSVEMSARGTKQRIVYLMACLHLVKADAELSGRGRSLPLSDIGQHFMWQ
jgi:hypothetical protein